MATKRMTSTRPYLLRAFYNWILDNELTPYMVVDASMPKVSVPEQYVDEEGKITLNVSPMATQGLDLNNKTVQFQARFSGINHEISVPIKAVQAIYARENGRGLVFSQDEFEDSSDVFEEDLVEVTDDKTPPTPPGSKAGGDKKRKASHLRIVK